jgi:DNA-binding MarR family transcriptional regulator
MTHKADYGKFCEIFGKTVRNLVLENILERGELDFAVSDILLEIKISKPKLYQIIREFEKENILVKSRLVAGTQLFVLNLKSRKAVFLYASFKRCLKLILNEYKQNKAFEHSVSTNGKVMPA